MVNRTEAPCRVLILSSKSPLAVIHYQDSGQVGLWSLAEGRQTFLRAEPELDYWDGED